MGSKVAPDLRMRFKVRFLDFPADRISIIEFLVPTKVRLITVPNKKSVNNAVSPNGKASGFEPFIAGSIPTTAVCMRD